MSNENIAAVHLIFVSGGAWVLFETTSTDPDYILSHFDYWCDLELGAHAMAQVQAVELVVNGVSLFIRSR